MANNSIGRVRIGQRQSTTIATSNWAVKNNVALADIIDVSTANVENGFALIYNSVTDRYEMKPVVEFPNISGGTFSNPNTEIQLKYSTVSDKPSYLNIAEPGYSYTSNVLFIGTPNSNGVINIGGYYYTKTLDDATSLLVANTIVKRDSFGNVTLNNITANVITAEINGNANSATQLKRPFNLNLTGDVTGNVNIDGASNASLNIQLVPTGVVAGEYGGSVQIPVLNVSSEGRIVSATNVSIATDLRIGTDAGTDTVSLLNDTLYIIGGDGITTELIPNDIINVKVDDTVIRTLPSSGRQTITGDLDIIGNIHITGNTFTANIVEYKVEDPILYLASNNYISDIIDIGLVGNYYDGSSQRHAGIIRKFNTNEFYIFTNYDEEFENNLLNIANPSLVYANVHANLVGGTISESIIDCGTY